MRRSRALFPVLDSDYSADRTVEDGLVVVVAQLDYAVALAKRAVAGAEFTSCRIQQGLQLAIQSVRAERSAIQSA